MLHMKEFDLKTSSQVTKNKYICSKNVGNPKIAIVFTGISRETFE